MRFKNAITKTVAIMPLLNGIQDVSSQHIEEKPNIVCIFVDDHAYQAISAYGHPISEKAPTPNIDRIAAKGMLYTHSYVENSISTPSRATLLTGLYSHQHGQTRLGCCMNDDKVWFTELLQEEGYRTAVVGKWHLNVEPKGFDYYDLLFDQGEYYNPSFRRPGTNGVYIREEGYATTLITDKAIDWIDKTVSAEAAFCILVNHKAPHRNWMPELKYLNLFNDIEFPEPETLFDDYSTRGPQMKTQELTIGNHLGYAFDFKIDELRNEPTLEYIKESWEPAISQLTDNQREIWDRAYAEQNKQFLENRPQGEELLRWKYQRYVKDYCRTIRSIDDQVGRLLDYLEKEGIADNTLIVYTSDQGFFLGEHGLYDKRFMYEEAFRTPLIISLPTLVSPNSVSHDLVQNIDLAPTFLDAAGIDIPDELPGRSLLPLLKDGTHDNWRDEVYYHFYDYPAVGNVRCHYGIRTKQYKLIHWYGKGYGNDKEIDFWELYDLEKDPHEINNVYEDRKYQQVRSTLITRLEQLKKDISITK